MLIWPELVSLGGIGDVTDAYMRGEREEGRERPCWSGRTLPGRSPPRRVGLPAWETMPS